jgi:hypothetical protein
VQLMLHKDTKAAVTIHHPPNFKMLLPRAHSIAWRDQVSRHVGKRSFRPGLWKKRGASSRAWVRASGTGRHHEAQLDGAETVSRLVRRRHPVSVP